MFVNNNNNNNKKLQKTTTITRSLFVSFFNLYPFYEKIKEKFGFVQVPKNQSQSPIVTVIPTNEQTLLIVMPIQNINKHTICSKQCFDHFVANEKITKVSESNHIYEYTCWFVVDSTGTLSFNNTDITKISTVLIKITNMEKINLHLIIKNNTSIDEVQFGIFTIFYYCGLFTKNQKTIREKLIETEYLLNNGKQKLVNDWNTFIEKKLKETKKKFGFIEAFKWLNAYKKVLKEKEQILITTYQLYCF